MKWKTRCYKKGNANIATCRWLIFCHSIISITFSVFLLANLFLKRLCSCHGNVLKCDLVINVLKNVINIALLKVIVISNINILFTHFAWQPVSNAMIFVHNIILFTALLMTQCNSFALNQTTYLLQLFFSSGNVVNSYYFSLFPSFVTSLDPNTHNGNKTIAIVLHATAQ